LIPLRTPFISLLHQRNRTGTSGRCQCRISSTSVTVQRQHFTLYTTGVSIFCCGESCCDTPVVKMTLDATSDVMRNNHNLHSADEHIHEVDHPPSQSLDVETSRGSSGSSSSMTTTGTGRSITVGHGQSLSPATEPTKEEENGDLDVDIHSPIARKRHKVEHLNSLIDDLPEPQQQQQQQSQQQQLTSQDDKVSGSTWLDDKNHLKGGMGSLDDHKEKKKNIDENSPGSDNDNDGVDHDHDSGQEDGDSVEIRATAKEEDREEEDGSRTEKDEENGDDDEEEELGEDSNGDDDDDDDDDEEEDEEELDDEAVLALQQILAATGGQIPIELLAQLQRSSQFRNRLAAAANIDEEDDFLEDVTTTTPLPYPPPQSLSDVARYIQSEDCKNIIILAGAGMSVASGIPDFRSPKDGLYATLQAHLLTCDNAEQEESIHADPSYALDQHLFLENPLPCLEVNRDFVLGIYERRWKATLAHRFVELLHAKTGKLCRLYTQNIDGLEDQCQLLPHSIRIAVHGSMDEACCAKCGAIMPMEQFCHEMRTKIKDWTRGIIPRKEDDQSNHDDDDDGGGGSQDDDNDGAANDPVSSSKSQPTVPSDAPTTSSPIICDSCGAPAVKPNIVLFRSPLPPQFFEYSIPDTQSADLLIILGTSLGVAPANSLVWRVPPTCMRVMLNREMVGWHLGFDPRQEDRDIFVRGDCEDLCLKLCIEMGWLSDLRPLIVNGDDDNDGDGEKTAHLPKSSEALLRAALEEENDDNSKDEDDDEEEEEDANS